MLRNIAGNIEALKNADWQFDECTVDAKICLGEIVGAYPFVDECVEFLVSRKYSVLRTKVDDAFIGHCDSNFDFTGWTTFHLVEALKFAQRSVSQSSLAC